jgi:hypothetical protein
MNLIVKRRAKTLLILTFIAFSGSVLSAAQMGERCLRDGECDSGECKKFQCVKRIRPKVDIGARCVFDGDCKSDECKGFVCVENPYKEDPAEKGKVQK